MANFSVATNKKWTDKNGQKQEEVCWHRIVVWGRNAENCQQYLAKGQPVFIDGEIVNRSYQDKQGVTKHTSEVHAHSVQFLGGKGEKQERSQDQQEQPGFDMSEIPF